MWCGYLKKNVRVVIHNVSDVFIPVFLYSGTVLTISSIFFSNNNRIKYTSPQVYTEPIVVDNHDITVRLCAKFEYVKFTCILFRVNILYWYIRYTIESN